jgi:hypothetical protein
MVSMSEQEKNALVGGLVLEHKGVLNDIGVLEGQAKKIAHILTNAANTLSSRPQNLIFDTEPHDIRFNGSSIKADDINGTKLLALTNELRTKIIRRDEIALQLKGMGVDINHV